MMFLLWSPPDITAIAPACRDRHDRGSVRTELFFRMQTSARKICVELGMSDAEIDELIAQDVLT